MKSWVWLAIVACVVAACGQNRPLTNSELEDLSNRSLREQVSRPAPDTCQMAAHQTLVGTLGSQIDQSRLPAGARVICHDCSVTMDYSAQRLNIELDRDGRVTRLRCG